MKIHYYMQFFPGINAVGSQRPFTLAKTLASRGHEITVISAVYNLNDGSQEMEIDEKIANKGRLKVIRIPCFRGGRGQNIQRLMSYLSFMVIAGAKGVVITRPDVVVGSIQPMFTGLAALGVARAKKVPFVLEICDLWPDALVVKKAIKKWQARPLFKLVDLLYHTSDRIVSVTPGIKKELLKKGIPTEKIDVLPIGFDPKLFYGSERRRDEIRTRYGWENDFVAIYTGSFTKVTALDVVIRAAAQLLNWPRIRFELFGNGPTRPEVERLAAEIGAKNVNFHDPVPITEVPALLAAADVSLMSLFKTPLAHIYFESKFMDYLGAGKPIMAAMEGEQAGIIRELNLGCVVGPGDYIGLARVIEQSLSGKIDLTLMGERGCEFVNRNLVLSSILDRYADIIEAAAERNLNKVKAWEPFQ